ncbi:hypothetical protein QQ054_26310 [Oscillatoria amoena NRMC-F 0135]|nr:hypothetical protein [Oscillatoria amoena NRMC-F 0135]
MKTIYLLIGAAVFASCSPTSHVPTMPCEPNFTGASQAQATGGVAFDHVELQGAVSVLPFLGVTYDYYRGTKGIRQQEYGANLFFPVNKQKTWFISFSAGKGYGSFEGYYSTSFLGSPAYTIKSQFNSDYLQASVYYVDKTKKDFTLKYSLALKQEDVHFDKFKVAYHSYSGLGYYTFDVYGETFKQESVTIRTPFFGISMEPKKGPVLVQMQIGYRNVFGRFKTIYTGYKGGDGAGIGIVIMNNYLHPLFEPFMFNMTVGFKLDYFKHRNKKNL